METEEAVDLIIKYIRESSVTAEEFIENLNWALARLGSEFYYENK